jgi:glycyl-radical enzyme activating protein
MFDTSEVGNIFNIQRFSLHDGPGIRTTVFLKGCPLDCLWCANPESKLFRPNITVNDLKCAKCGACISACPNQAIRFDENNCRSIDWSKCDQCLSCATVCNYGAIKVCGAETNVETIIDEIVKDLDFYRNSDGGVTISGGEPLQQYRFVNQLLQACKSLHIHTALDTSGYCKWEQMQNVLVSADLVLFDIKQLDPQKHREATGVDNDTIIRNLENTAKTTQVWIRIPLISEFNDSEEHILKVATLAKKNNVAKISLLPYHDGGKSKCRQIGIAYNGNGFRAPDKEHIEKLINLLKRAELEVSVGR